MKVVPQFQQTKKNSSIAIINTDENNKICNTKQEK